MSNFSFITTITSLSGCKITKKNRNLQIFFNKYFCISENIYIFAPENIYINMVSNIIDSNITVIYII